MTFHIGKAEVRLSIGVLPLFAALIALGEGKAFALSLTALLIHECAHLIAARNLGFRVLRFSFYPFGAVMQFDSLCAAQNSEWIVSLAGPLGSLAAASAAGLAAHAIPMLEETLDLFVHTNAALTLLNLLPAYPLDGGRIARSLLLRCVSEQGSRRILFAFTAAVSLLMLGFGIWCILNGLPAWTLPAIAPYLVVSAWIEWKRAKPNAVANVIERRAAQKTGRALRAQIIVLDGSATVGAAMQTLSNRHFTILRIQTEKGVIETDENVLIDAASRFGYQATLKDAFLD